MNTHHARQELNKKLRESELAREAIRGESKNLSKAKQELADTETARNILQSLVMETQYQLHEQISAIATDCLATIFGPRYSLRLKFEAKAGKSQPSFLLVDGENEIDPMDASGGGVVDVAAFALRVGALVLSGSPSTLVLDEPLKFVSAGYRECIQEMIQGLADALGLQIIMVTHIEELETGTIIHIERKP